MNDSGFYVNFCGNKSLVPMKKSDLFFNVLRLPVDFIMLLTAGLATYLFRTEILSAFRPVLFEFNLPLLKYFYLVVFVSLLFLGAFAASGLYSMKSRLKITEEFFKILISSSAGIMIVIIYIFLRQELFNSRFLVLGSWFFAILFVFIGRLIIRWIQSIAVAKYDFGIHKLVLIGGGEISSKIALEIKNNPSSGYRVVKQINYPIISDVELAISQLGADEVVLADIGFSAGEVSEIIDLCHERHVVFKFVPAISHIFSSNFEPDIFNGFPLIELKRTRLDGWGKIIKRVVDVCGAAVSLTLFLPIFAISAFAIKWETEGSVFARLKRVSRNKEFNLYKFRSMIENAEELKPLLVAFNERSGGPLFKMRDDPRVTKVGKLMRKLRIDELPQLWNVLKGDISLVGPRPHQPDEVAHYQRHHKKVLAIKSGATGLAQVSGSSDLDFEEEVVLDSFYIDNWSLWLDFKIIVRTIIKMFFDRSAV